MLYFSIRKGLLLFLSITAFITSCSNDSSSSSDDNSDDSAMDDDIVIVEEWQRTLGGSSEDNPRALVKTTDGGYLIGGTSSSNISGDKTENSKGGSDFWVIKLDQNGNEQWQKTIGGSDDDTLRSISVTNDGGYLLGGTSASNISGDKTENSRGGLDYWIVKIGMSGGIQWQKTIGGNMDDFLANVFEISTGEYVLGGTSKSDISGDRTVSRNPNNPSDAWVLKLDSNGNIINQKAHNNLGLTYFVAEMIPTNNDRYILSGRMIQSGPEFNHIIKLWDDLSRQWEMSYGDSTLDTTLTDIIETSDGGFILSGINDYDYYILKIAGNGDVEWEKQFGGLQGDQADTIIELSNGDYVVAGYSGSGASGDKNEESRGGTDYWLVKLSPSGAILNQKTFGGSNTERVFNIVEANDGGLVLSGYSNSDISGEKTENSRGGQDFWILKTNALN